MVGVVVVVVVGVGVEGRGRVLARVVSVVRGEVEVESGVVDILLTVLGIEHRRGSLVGGSVCV